LEHKHTGILFDADCSNIQKDFDVNDVSSDCVRNINIAMDPA